MIVFGDRQIQPAVQAERLRHQPLPSLHGGPRGPHCLHDGTTESQRDHGADLADAEERRKRRKQRKWRKSTKDGQGLKIYVILLNVLL